VEGRKTRAFDISKMDDISDADFELIQGAVQDSVFGAEAMEVMLAETSRKEVGSGNR
jgi:hypothetical protein